MKASKATPISVLILFFILSLFLTACQSNPRSGDYKEHRKFGRASLGQNQGPSSRLNKRVQEGKEPMSQKESAILLYTRKQADSLANLKTPPTPSGAPDPASSVASGAADGSQNTAQINKKTAGILAPIPPEPEQLQFPELSYQPPNPEDYRVEIAPGIIAYLYPAPQLPMIQASILFPGQNYAEKPEEVAALSLLAELYRTGGTKNLTPAQVDDSLEFLASGVSLGFNDHYGTISVNSMKNDFWNSMLLAKEMVFQPGLDSARLAITKVGYIQALEHKWDKPEALLNDLYEWVLYQPHPVWWRAKPEEVEAVHRNTVLKAHQAEHPSPFTTPRIYLGISGDFQKNEMIARLKGYFSDWKRDAAAKDLPRPTLNNRKGVFVADKDTKQATIKLGQPFLQRPHPDYYAASLASYMLGAGGFTSRLTARIRSEQGLAYTVYSFTGSNYQYPVTSGVFLQTKVESAAYALKLIQEEIQKAIDEGFTDEEYARAKDGLIASLPGLFKTPGNTAEVFAMSESWGRELDHFRVYPEKIQALTKDQVQSALRKYFSPENMAITIVGPYDKLKVRDEEHDIALQDLGPVHLIPLDSLERQ